MDPLSASQPNTGYHKLGTEASTLCALRRALPPAQRGDRESSSPSAIAAGQLPTLSARTSPLSNDLGLSRRHLARQPNPPPNEREPGHPDRAHCVCCSQGRWRLPEHRLDRSPAAPAGGSPRAGEESGGPADGSQARRSPHRSDLLRSRYSFDIDADLGDKTLRASEARVSVDEARDSEVIG
jgi:hypothetical protein